MAEPGLWGCDGKIDGQAAFFFMFLSLLSCGVKYGGPAAPNYVSCSTIALGFDLRSRAEQVREEAVAF